MDMEEFHDDLVEFIIKSTGLPREVVLRVLWAERIYFLANLYNGGD